MNEQVFSAMLDESVRIVEDGEPLLYARNVLDDLERRGLDYSQAHRVQIVRVLIDKASCQLLIRHGFKVLG